MSFRLLCVSIIPCIAFLVRVEYGSYVDTASLNAEVGGVQQSRERFKGFEGKPTEVCCARPSSAVQGRYSSFMKKINSCAAKNIVAAATNRHKEQVVDVCCANAAVDATQPVQGGRCTSDLTDCSKYDAVSNGDKCVCPGGTMCSQTNDEIRLEYMTILYRFECADFNDDEARSYSLQCRPDECSNYNAIQVTDRLYKLYKVHCQCNEDTPLASYRFSKLLITQGQEPRDSQGRVDGQAAGNPVVRATNGISATDMFILPYAYGLRLECVVTSCTDAEYNGAVEAHGKPGVCSCGAKQCHADASVHACNYDEETKEWHFDLRTAQHEKASCAE